MATNQQAGSSAWASLRIAAFRAIWFASPLGQYALPLLKKHQKTSPLSGKEAG